MQSQYKKFVISLLLVIITIFISPVILNLIVDPYQIYHKHDKGFLTKQRYQNAGLINSYLDDNKSKNSIIIGTSRTENFKSSKVAEAIHFDNVLKLSLSGSQPYEQKILLDYALETKKIHNVIWGISPAYSRLAAYPESKKTNGRIQKALYGDLIGQLNYYLFNIDTLSLSIDVLLSNTKFEKNLDNLNNWHQRVTNRGSYKKYNSKQNIKKLTKKLFKRRKKLGKYQYNYVNNFPLIDENVIKTIKEHPNVNFYLYFEPVSMFLHSLRLSGGNERFDRTLSLRRYMLMQLKDLHNVELYAFDLAPFTYELKNWKDGGHHHEKWNQYIIEMIKNKEFRLKKNNILDYENKFIDSINQYEIK